MKHHIIRLKQGFLFLLFHLVLIGFSSVFLPPLFARQGLPAYSFVILIVIGTFFTSVLIPFFNNFQINKSLALGYVSLGLMTLTIVYLPTTIAFISYAFLWAFGIIFFWQPINYLFYKSSKNKTNATDSSLYFLLGGITGVISPLIAGFLLRDYGYTTIFTIVASGYFCSALFTLYYAPKERVESNFIKAVHQYKKLKTISMIEGALHFVTFVIIPTFTVFFYSKETSFGAFASYIALIGLLIGVVLALRSDKTQKRLGYFLFLLMLMGIFIVSLGFIETPRQWLIMVGLFTIVYQISNPIRFAIAMDVKKVDLGFWRAREFFLNVGRFVYLSVAAVLFFLGLLKTLFLVTGSLCIIYIILLKIKWPELE